MQFRMENEQPLLLTISSQNIFYLIPDHAINLVREHPFNLKGRGDYGYFRS